MKKTLIVFLAILSLMLTTGCDSYAPFVRLEERIMVQLVGIDWEDDIYTVSMQFCMGKTSDGGKNENDIKTAKGEGVSLYAAIRKIRETVGKEVFCPHNQLVILGEGAIKNNAVHIMEDYFDYCYSHATAYVAGVSGKAEDMVAITYSDEYAEKKNIR